MALTMVRRYDTGKTSQDKSLNEALRIARTRGVVLKIQQEPESPGDLMVLNGMQGSLVRVKRTLRLHCTLQETEAHFADAIKKLRSVPVPAGIRRELWVWSRYRTWRFFVVVERGIEELVMMVQQIVPIRSMSLPLRHCFRGTRIISSKPVHPAIRLKPSYMESTCSGKLRKSPDMGLDCPTFPAGQLLIGNE